MKIDVDLDKIWLGDYGCCIEERCLRGPVRRRHQMPGRPSPSKAPFRIYVQKPSPRSGQVRRPDRMRNILRHLLFRVAFYSPEGKLPEGDARLEILGKRSRIERGGLDGGDGDEAR